MSVEDIQDVNKLAQELLDHGLEASREDAVKKAEEMLNKKLVEAKQSVVTEQDDMSRIKNIAERTKDHLDRQIGNFKQEIMRLDGEINALKEQIKELRRPTGEFKASQETGLTDEKVSEAAKEPVEPVKVEEEEKTEEKKESHPKRGNYTSKDVSMEKVFYCGKK